MKEIILARLYSNVFRDKPWNEAFLNEDGKFIPLDEGLADWSQGKLQLAYPLRPTAEYIKLETNKPDSVKIYIPDPKKPKRVIAFGWGFSFPSPSELVDTKWTSANQEYRYVMSQLISNTCQTGGPIWYLSEVGVLPSFQGQGIGSNIVGELIQKAPTLPIVMRTNQDSPMTHIADKYGFERILGPDTSYLDPINSKRVLYAKRSL